MNVLFEWRTRIVSVEHVYIQFQVTFKLYLVELFNLPNVLWYSMIISSEMHSSRLLKWFYSVIYICVFQNNVVQLKAEIANRKCYLNFKVKAAVAICKPIQFHLIHRIILHHECNNSDIQLLFWMWTFYYFHAFMFILSVIFLHICVRMHVHSCYVCLA